MITKGELIHNPAINLRVKGTKEKLPSELLTKKQIRASLMKTTKLKHQARNEIK
jgi:hypothetical protein